MQHGELREYRAKKGQLQLEDFPPWMQEHWSARTLELLLGAEASHCKEIAQLPYVKLAPWESLYPPLRSDDAASAALRAARL